MRATVNAVLLAVLGCQLVSLLLILPTKVNLARATTLLARDAGGRIRLSADGGHLFGWIYASKSFRNRQSSFVGGGITARSKQHVRL